jgi:hypothetical protein
MCVAHCDPKALGHPAWNAGRRLVQKATKTVRAFDLAIDSKLRGCDLMKQKSEDLSQAYRCTNAVINPDLKCYGLWWR